MTLLRFHLDCTDCGSIPKSFHTCPWQFLRITTTCNYSVQSRMYLLFFPSSVSQRLSGPSYGRARNVFNHRPCHILVVSCTLKLRRRRVFYRASTCFNHLGIFGNAQPSSTFINLVRRQFVKLGDWDTERDFVCHLCVQRWNQAEITAGDVGPNLGHSWFHFHGRKGHKAHLKHKQYIQYIQYVQWQYVYIYIYIYYYILYNIYSNI